MQQDGLHRQLYYLNKQGLAVLQKAQDDEPTPDLDPETGLLSREGVTFYDSLAAAVQGKLDADPLIQLEIKGDDLPTGKALKSYIQAASEDLYDALLEPYTARREVERERQDRIQQEPAQGAEVLPVSYTHLTLPTKRIV